jgi:glycosyltransferase domain-containing protein
MLIHDPSSFSVVVPTFNGTPYLRRLLDYFRHIAFEGAIVLSDNSSGEHREFVMACPREYGDLDIEVRPFAHGVRFLDKLTETLGKMDSRFVMLHAHDDFMIPAAVERCVAFLAENPDYSVARGRVAMIAFARDSAANLKVSLVAHPMRGYEDDDAPTRVLRHIERYASTFYSVHRREALIESFQRTEAATKNVIFFQYLSSCICVLRGKVCCLDELFYVRQGHEDSWSGNLKNSADYGHWPMLITAPEFSRYYQEFRTSLSTLVEEACGTPAIEYGSRVDRAAIDLFRRSICGEERDNIEEAQFLERLENTASPENALLKSVIQFAAPYADTL